MKLHEKIRHIRKNVRRIKLRQLHMKLVQLFGIKALSYKTLLRIEKGHTDGRASSIHQICVGLGVTLQELKEGTEEEMGVADIVPRSGRHERYYYNEKVYAELLISRKRRFLATALILPARAKTNIEADPSEVNQFEKWIYVTMGKLTMHISSDQYDLKKGDSLSFESSLPHFFENKSDSKAKCIVVQNPRSI